MSKIKGMMKILNFDIDYIVAWIATAWFQYIVVKSATDTPMNISLMSIDT